MNQKVEEEIAIYLNRNVLNRIKNDDTIDGFTTIEAGELAEHFYNLGLSDAKDAQAPTMIQWKGDNLKEVITFTGKSPLFNKWFKTWEEYEEYVHSHGDIFKMFYDDGSHFEVPVGAWIVKTPDGYNVPSVARFIHAKQEQQEVDFEKAYKSYMESRKDDLSGNAVTVNVKDMARYFFEFALNARKK